MFHRELPRRSRMTRVVTTELFDRGDRAIFIIEGKQALTDWKVT
jgi:hypothetical protein